MSPLLASARSMRERAPPRDEDTTVTRSNSGRWVEHALPVRTFSSSSLLKKGATALLGSCLSDPARSIMYWRSISSLATFRIFFCGGSEEEVDGSSIARSMHLRSRYPVACSLRISGFFLMNSSASSTFDGSMLWYWKSSGKYLFLYSL